MNNPRVYMALLHYPVYNKAGKIVAAAITNLDLHDLARMAVTFELARCYVITPLELQRKLAQRLMSHWLKGPGADKNWTRQQAFRRVKVLDELKPALEEIQAETGKRPALVATTAREIKGQASFQKLRRMMAENREQSWLLLFGTGWGLTEEFMLSDCDYILEPIRGNSSYNHLSVRSAAAIILDRLLAIDRA